jgi:hypothetical protein
LSFCGVYRNGHDPIPGDTKKNTFEPKYAWECDNEDINIKVKETRTMSIKIIIIKNNENQS